MSKTTKPKSLAEHLNAAETELAKHDGPIRAELNALTAKLPELTAEVERARKRPAEIEAEWANGDNSASAADHAEALSNIGRADLLCAGARRGIEQARKRLSADEHHAAEALAQQLRHVLPEGFTVAATHAPAAYWSEGIHELQAPLYVVVQTEPTRHSDGATPSGSLATSKVELHLIRTPLYAPPEFDKLAALLSERRGVALKVDQFRTKGDIAKLDIYGVHPEMPVIPVVDLDAARALPREVARRAINRADGDRIVSTRRTGYVPSPRDMWVVHGRRGGVIYGDREQIKVSERVDGNVRTVSVSTGMNAATRDDSTPYLRDEWTRQVHKLAPFVGVCQSATYNGSTYEAEFVSLVA